MAGGAAWAKALDWEQYSLLDAGAAAARDGETEVLGERLERWGSFTVRRPEPLASRWPQDNGYRWSMPDAWCKGDAGAGTWVLLPGLADKWVISRGRLSFRVGPSGRKQMGLFPEQAPNWDWIARKIRSREAQVELLNLFAYSGGATVAAAEAGASVCHVDASRTAVALAKDNLELSNLAHSHVRFIIDDAGKFVDREIRRGRHYDAVIMDPPSFGRGPGGETWEIHRDLQPLIERCALLIARSPLFMLVSFHTTGLDAGSVAGILKKCGSLSPGATHASEMTMRSESGKTLNCGVTVRWEAL